MIKIKDNFLIMSDERQESAIEHLIKLSKHPAFRKEKVRIMPDYHEGVGAVIGFTSTYSDLIIPNVVGVDIGCGVIAYPLKKGVNTSKENLERLDKHIRKNIPVGFKIRNNFHKEINNKDNRNFIEYISKYKGYDLTWILDIQNKLDTGTNLLQFDIKDIIQTYIKDRTYFNYTFDKHIEALTSERVLNSLGTLGGGNHFCSLEKDENTGTVFVVIHSGSRNFGLQIASIFQKLAIYLKDKFYIENIEKDLAYLPMDIGGEEYLKYVRYAEIFAYINRRLMLRDILKFFGTAYESEKVIESVHNYIDIEHKIIRKGAIELRNGKQVIIPLNMRDGSIIGVGKNNKELYNWNFSAPHGAGRVMGRNEAKKKLKLEDFKKSMDGIFSTSISEKTIDEAPMVYKNSNMILNLLDDIIDVKYRLKPIYNLKADN